MSIAIHILFSNQIHIYTYVRTLCIHIVAMKFKEAFDKCQAELRTNKTSNFPADGMAVGEDGYAVKQNVIHNGDD